MCMGIQIEGLQKKGKKQPDNNNLFICRFLQLNITNMIIKEVLAKAILDSRGEKTIEVSVNNSSASAPYGASRGKHEKKAYKKNPEGDIKFINDLAKKMRNQQKYAFPEINKFRDLMLIEKKLKNKI